MNPQLASKFQSLSKTQKANFIRQLDELSFIQFRYFTDVMLRPNQIIQPGNWRYWLFIGGRGTGKTKTGAVEIRKRVYQKQDGLMVVASTQSELLKVMIPAILAEFPVEHRPKYVGGDQKILKCHNGVIIDCRTSQQGEIRGPNASFVWLDELVKCWDSNPDKIELNFAILDASIRKGDAQILITTTGNNWSIFKKFYDRYEAQDPAVVWVRGSMKENEYLSPSTIKALETTYGNNRYTQQELEGIINWETEGALWNTQMLEKMRFRSLEEVANPPNPNNMKRYKNAMDFFLCFFIGVDPATTAHDKSDAWGLVVSALGRDNHLYVIQDASKVMTPTQAAETIKQLYQNYRAPRIIAESNQGGLMVDMVLRTTLPNVKPFLVHVSQHKMTRAQPLAVLSDQQRLHLCGSFPALEAEMCNYTGDEKQKSPNRLDALVLSCQPYLEPANYSSGTYNLPKFG